MPKVKTPAPSGYDYEEYEHINALLSNSDFDLSIDALCRCFRNPSERNRFVEYEKFGNKKMPLRILGVLYKNSVWTAHSIKYTPTSNLIYHLLLVEPCIVDLNKHLIYDGVPSTPYNYTTQDETNLSLKEGMTLLEVLYEKYKDEYERNCINKEEGKGKVKYSKVIDGEEYQIFFRFYTSIDGRCGVNITINCPAIFEIAKLEEEEVRKEKQRKEEEEQRRREERKRKEEEEKRRQEEAKRRAEIKYRNDLSNLL